MSEIRYAEYSDLKIIAECHIQAFPDSFSAKLGLSYCKKMLEWYVSSEKGVLLFLRDQEDVCLGYCGGILNDGTLETGSSSSMIQYSFTQGLRALVIRPWLVVSKPMRSNYKLVFRNLSSKLGLKKIKRSDEVKSIMSSDPYVGLVVIGVLREFRGKGYGSLLMYALEGHTRKLKYSKMTLSVNVENSAAIAAYKRNGWVSISKQDGMFIMQKKVFEV